MTQKYYFNDFEFVEMDVPESGRVACFMSGGVDSALVCYLLAKTITDNKLSTKVYPMTAEMLKRPFNLRHASDVIVAIEKLTGFKFEDHLCYYIPNHRQKISDEEKVGIHSLRTSSYMEAYGISTLYSGLSANPPREKLPDTPMAERQACRDDEEWRKKKENKPGLKVPLIRVDKKKIASLYKSLDLLKSLLPLTRSCEAEMEETEFFKKTCSQVRPQAEHCWWCQERAYGFQEFL